MPEGTKACRLLQETDLYAGRIAREVGHRSVGAFTRRFVAVTKCHAHGLSMPESISTGARRTNTDTPMHVT